MLFEVHALKPSLPVASAVVAGVGYDNMQPNGGRTERLVAAHNKMITLQRQSASKDTLRISECQPMFLTI